MPTYVYNCKECNYDRDIKHGMTETPVIECEECNTVMKKVIRSTSFQLKGNGWFGKSKQK